MKLEELQELVDHKHTRKYVVKTNEGARKMVRLWKDNGSVYIVSKGLRKWGHNVAIERIGEWKSIKPYEKPKVDLYKRVMKRAKDAQRMLSESGLWVDIKNEIDAFLSLEKRQIEDFLADAENDGVCYKLREKYPWLKSIQIFESFMADRCWYSIPFNKYNREHYTKCLTDAIDNKRPYKLFWINGYDCRVEVDTNDKGSMRGWLSCEFRGCGNGHYYLLFDSTHAIFYEDD